MNSERRVPSRAWAWLGLEVVATGDGTATVKMTPTEDMANLAGYVHGGMISALADSAMARSVHTLRRRSVERVISFDLKLNFISAARIGETLSAEGRVIHSGRRTVVTGCRIEDSAGRLVATATGTFAVKKGDEQSDMTESPDAD